MLCLVAAGCGYQHKPPTSTTSAEAPPIVHEVPTDPALVAPITPPREVFPGVRVDANAKVVEFDAAVSPMLVPDPRAPLFFLEQVACSPDTREHESLLVTRVKPSHIHAAMLAIGLRPGAPGGWRMDGDRLVPIDPTGDRIELRFAYTLPGNSPVESAVDPLLWIVSADGQRTVADAMRPLSSEHGRPAPGWVFGGSRIVNGRRSAKASPTEPAEVYEADGAGTVIGLTSFGSEVISWSHTISPDAGIDAPEWVAKMDVLPPAGTAVVVRIRPGH